MRRLIAVLMAYAVALGVAWFVQVKTVGALFAPGPQGEVWPTVVMAPLAGLAVFALIFGLLVGTMPRWRYWVFAPLAVVGVGGVALWAMVRGVVAPPVAALGLVLALLVVALITLGPERA
ncbi:hypothetical protein K1T73_10610 [Roseovarius sp. SCSIO 43702]|uniref:hypothetical protein n=1 Tax=Roseovarius sp. SCSIO 43702 TaxID=2823043 RepID=UPI001C73A99B|nr:hypothetical protein [Roseovarius sp. SCSIO 43702]QYX55550.1 hypothetical protein K1T73_10610 [Roseovarius sp. SCSIO 43702]